MKYLSPEVCEWLEGPSRGQRKIREAQERSGRPTRRSARPKQRFERGWEAHPEDRVGSGSPPESLVGVGRPTRRSRKG